MFVAVILVALACRSVLAAEFVPFDTSRLHSDSFLEQFRYDGLINSSWIPCQAEKLDEQLTKSVPYSGNWSIEEASKWPVFDNEKGLVMKTVAAHHGIFRRLPVPFDNTDKDLVLQYEVSLQAGLECGGAYIKLLGQDYDHTNFNSETPYQIMFGPDVCGANNQVNLALGHRHRINGKYEKKFITNLPLARIGDLTTLYTLIIKSNQDFEIRINGEVARAGNLVHDEDVMNPPLNPPLEIIDVKDSKPLFWDDRKYIPDPEKPKPADYDEKYGKRTIPDPNAVKPQDWNEKEPLYIDDPNAKRPQDWDDEVDGTWLAPEIMNPKCIGISGCGPWTPPIIDNPEYRGPWLQETLDNPNYHGEWHPRMIANPEYYEETAPSNLDEIVAGIGFELWSMNKDIMFSNIYLGHDISEAELIGNETWKAKYELQGEMKLHNLPPVKFEANEPPKNVEELLITDDASTFSQFLLFIRLFWWKQYLHFLDFMYELFQDPLQAVTKDPISFILYAVVFSMTMAITFGVLGVIMFLLTSQPEEQDDTQQTASNTETVEKNGTDKYVQVPSFQPHSTKITKRKV